MDPNEEPQAAVVYGGTAFPAGNDDFRAARNYCAQACRQFNNTPEDAPPEVRSSRWLEYVSVSHSSPSVIHPKPP